MGVLRTQHNKSLAATVELSLASPMFQDLGPDARELLGVIAFFPQGVDENNLNWFFPTLPNIASIFDNFCVLSLAYRSSGFATMLAPLRDYLCPKNPGSSRLLCVARDSYFNRLSVHVTPGEPGFEEARWIVLEDVNVEHLLDAFTSVDTSSNDLWNACADFLAHLGWHKPRPVMLGPKIEGLPDSHPSKPECLTDLSRLLHSTGVFVEAKWLLIHTLKIWRERGGDVQIAQTLGFLADVNWLLGLCDEGIPQAKEGLEIYERLGNIWGQASSLQRLSQLYRAVQCLDAAEEVTSRALDLSLRKNDQFLICQSHFHFGDIYRAKGEAEKAINHLETAIRVASSDWDDILFSSHYVLANVFIGEGRLDDAHVHAERSKLHVANHPFNLGYAMDLQARVWYRQRRLEEAKSEVSRAVEVFEKLGATRELGDTSSRKFLQGIHEGINYLTATHG